jgi:hypothetical protein
MPEPGSTKYTLIWQSKTPRTREWIHEILAPYLCDEVFDTKREIVVDNAILVDDFIYARDPEYYREFRGKNAFLIHLQDEFFEIGLDIYSNFRGVLRNHWASVFNPRYVKRWLYGYPIGARRNRVPVPATQRQYVWSFLGQCSTATRPDVPRELSRVEPHFFFATDRMPGWEIFNPALGVSKRFTVDQCAEVLAQSSFAPAPMGNVHAECYREYEALEAGCIPILERRLTLDYYRMIWGDHPVPTVRSWAAARRLIADLLKHPDRMDDLQRQCIEWWDEYKLKYSREVGEFLVERSADTEPVGELIQGWGKMPGWRVVELMRHHDARAGYRRVKRQVSRAMKTGAWRVAHRASQKPK